ncbi:DUF2711 family protein [Aneurinibacillus uraniidurans]|uniref:DUF2711 family protein n=1 Tax=Aneurinibacillus uraniidurans TaxID=2966586 RepID=UPI00234BB483|nr:DUF2711 family protein [Aneurinibacillus sp. B1]WCN39678.1 DUF2711 family protein [Aneurinibacillus sp. B1]
MNKTRVIPEPHRYAVCAPADIPIKTFYKGVFDEVFIFLHPFIKPITIDIESFYPDTYPCKNDVIRTCELITWTEFLKLSCIRDFRQLDIGLRTMILGLRKQFANEHLAKVIKDTCEQKKLVPPTEGCLPELLTNRLLQAVKNEGHDWFWVGDEFCTERKLEYIDDLVKDNDPFGNQHLNLFTHDNKILFTTHWDSHFSMVCSDKDTINKIVDYCNLEGFYCDEQTEIYWSCQDEQ